MVTMKCISPDAHGCLILGIGNIWASSQHVAERLQKQRNTTRSQMDATIAQMHAIHSKSWSVFIS